MVEPWVFVASNNLAELAEATTRSGGVFDDFDNIIISIRERTGGDVAAIFARPVVTRGNGASLTSVSWYSSRRGNIQSWADLDYDTQSRATAELAGLLERLRPLTVDEKLGEPIQRWLNLPRLSGNLFLIGNSPVLINWGLLPVAAVERIQEREKLFMAGLGRFAPWSPVPPFAATDTALFAAGSPVQQQAFTSAIAIPTAAASVAAVPGGLAMPAQVIERRISWRSLAIVTAIAALTLLILLIPGILRYDSHALVATAQAEEQTAYILRQRIADLQSTLGTPICEIGALRGTPAELLLPPVPGAAALRYQPDNSLPPVGDATARTSVAPTPTAVDPPLDAGTDQTATSATNLVEFLDQTSVLIVVEGETQIATGTGFFVNPTDIVTNLHVIEGMMSSPIYVVNASFDRPVQASIVATTQSAEAGHLDLAVLRISNPVPRAFLKLATDVPRGSNVLAFGFPSFVLDSGTQFQCLMSGGMQAADSRCIPYGSVTTGMVTALQQGEDGVPLVLHSAAISEGNSGGPLVDYCGRAVGMNTFGRRDVQRVQQLNFAQQGTAISRFLTSNSIPHEVETTGCALVPVAAQPIAIVVPQSAPAEPAQPDGQAEPTLPAQS